MREIVCVILIVGALLMGPMIWSLFRGDKSDKGMIPMIYLSMYTEFIVLYLIFWS